jgi:hypothetical protein
MQSLPIYLYPNTLDVTLDLDPTVRGVNRVMYQRDLKVQKGIKNKIRIQFKNSDQKRITISEDDIYIFCLFDTTNQRLLLEKQLTILDDGTTLATRGLAELVLTESDTMNLDVSDYQFSVKKQDTDGTYLPAYSNTYYGVAGFLKVAQDVYPMLQPSQEVVSFEPTYDDLIQKYQYRSGNVYAYPEYNSNTALHTAAVYLTGYKGQLKIEGTLYNSPSSFNRYVTIATQTYNGFSGIDYFNFNGVFSYVRFTFIPDVAPGESNNNNPEYYGSFDKVLYRC